MSSRLVSPIPGQRASGAREAGGQTTRLVVVSVLFVLALGGVALSWRFSHPRPRVVENDDMARCAALRDEAGQAVASIQARLRADAAPVVFDGLDVRKEVVAAAIPEPATPTPANITFRLRGVVPTGNPPVAFVDDRTVSLGESIDGFKVVAIAAESMTVRDASGRTHVIKLYGE